jgi:hypothetical protein
VPGIAPKSETFTRLLSTRSARPAQSIPDPDAVESTGLACGNVAPIDPRERTAASNAPALSVKFRRVRSGGFNEILFVAFGIAFLHVQLDNPCGYPGDNRTGRHIIENDRVGPNH